MLQVRDCCSHERLPQRLHAVPWACYVWEHACTAGTEHSRATLQVYKLGLRPAKGRLPTTPGAEPSQKSQIARPTTIGYCPEVYAFWLMHSWSHSGPYKGIIEQTFIARISAALKPAVSSAAGSSSCASGCCLWPAISPAAELTNSPSHQAEQRCSSVHAASLAAWAAMSAWDASAVHHQFSAHGMSSRFYPFMGWP